MQTLIWKFLLMIPAIVADRSFDKAALIIVDVQNDFCAGGSIAVPHGDDVIPVINDLRSELEFRKVIFTMDWHPPNHISFFERFQDKEKYPGAELYEEFTFDLGDGRGKRTQRLWPVHCVQNTIGAELRVGLDTGSEDSIVRKGTKVDVDSYSGFVDNDGTSETELDVLLINYGIKELFITGLAFEFCVGNTALDGAKKGYNVTILEDAVGYIYPPDTESMTQKLKRAGVKIMTTKDLINNGKTWAGIPILVLSSFGFHWMKIYFI